VIITGVPDGGDYGNYDAPSIPTLTAEKNPLPIANPYAPADDYPMACDQPETYVRVILSNGDDDDPGAIAEGFVTVLDGELTLVDGARKHLATRKLYRGEDALSVARGLLREDAGNSFDRPLKYPKTGVA
jgi:hypothetical protein